MLSYYGNQYFQSKDTEVKSQQGLNLTLLDKEKWNVTFYRLSISLQMKIILPITASAQISWTLSHPDVNLVLLRVLWSFTINEYLEKNKVFMSDESKNGKFVSTSYQHRDISPVPGKSSGFIWKCA